MARRIALIGGSFNPPHLGHLWAATFIRATHEVDEVWLVPAFRHPFGKSLASFEERLAMCELLCRDTAGWLKASPVERDVCGEGWTVELLEHLHRVRPDDSWLWLIGSDILDELPRWRSFDRVEQLSSVVVLHRAGYPSPRSVGPAMVEISSSEIRERLGRGERPDGLVPRTVLDYIAAHGLYPAAE